MARADASIQYHDEDTDLVFVWHGGAYIEVMFDGEARDVINVWADAEDISHLEQEAMLANRRRPFRHILELFEERCDQYLAEQLSEV